MKKNDYDWLELIVDVAEGFLTGFMIGASETNNVNTESNENEVEDLGYAVIVEDDEIY